jgi:hypothetical protein
LPADLTVVAVRLPTPLRAPCPVPVLVVIQNIGTDPADRTPYDVTVDLTIGEDYPGGSFEEMVRTPEDQQLSPGRTIVVPVQVRFPCTLYPVMLRATVDKKQQIPNRKMPPTAPFKDVTGLMPAMVPWLVTSLRVGISDATGIVTFDPDGFCPGKPVVAEISIDNRGCVASKPSTTEVTLEDAHSVPFPMPLATQTYVVPALAPGGNNARSLSFATPSSVTGTSGWLAVRVRADSNMANPD